MSKIVFFGNYKGGVGKTTSVYNIARYLSEEPYNKRILLLDLDPQSSLSDICLKYFRDTTANIKDDVEDGACLNYVYDLYIRKIQKYNNLKLNFDVNKLVRRKGNLCFILSNLYYPNKSSAAHKLGLDELAMKMNDSVEYMAILKNLIDDIEQNYEIKDEADNIQNAQFDYIFIDCPPANNIITKGAFLAADYFAIPTILDRVSTNGVIHYIETVAGTYKQYCKESEDAIIYKHLFGNMPKLIGIFYTFIRGQAHYSDDNRNFIQALETAKKVTEKKGDEEVLELLENYHIFSNYINNYVDIARSLAVGETSNARADYERLTKEFLDRLQQL